MNAMATSVGKSRATRVTAPSLPDRPWLGVASVIGLGVVLESVLRVTRFVLPVAPAFVAFGLIALVLAGVRPRHVRTPVDLAIGASVLAGIIAFVINSHGGRRLIACGCMGGSRKRAMEGK